MVDVCKHQVGKATLRVSQCLHAVKSNQTRFHHHQIAMALTYEPHLMQLSDDVILHIMSFLNSSDVYALSQ